MPGTFLSDFQVLTQFILTIAGLLNGLSSVGLKTRNNFILFYHGFSTPFL